MPGLTAIGYALAGCYTWEFSPFLNRNGGGMSEDRGGGGRTGMIGETGKE